MKAEAIFGPVCVLALWTVVVLGRMGRARVGAVRAGRLRSSAFKVGESCDVPPEMAVINRNFLNLLEMPVLFYVVCLCLYVTRNVHPALVGLAWAYVVLRLVHSFIHLGNNRVTHRFLAFVTSNFVLLAMWIWLLVQVA